MTRYESLYIVGLGASAGGFEALLKFLQQLQKGHDIAYVIVQHLDPNQPTMLGNLLSKYTQLPIVEITQGIKPKKDTVYFCPPNKDLVISKGVFLLSDPKTKAYPKPSINKFFESLALEKKSKAIGVILSGTGSDGAEGIKEIHKQGGMTIAEDEGAKYFSMPKAAIDTGVIDTVLPPELIAKGMPHLINDKDYFLKQYEVKGSLNKIFDLLNKKTGIDFSSYKDNTVSRRIKKRMSDTKSKDTDGYLNYLYTNDDEVEKLKDELLIIVTSFFRGAEAFNELSHRLQAHILQKKDGDLRIWIPACATGEEAYSIAIVVKEILLRLDTDLKVTIFATDVSDIAVESARNKTYSYEQTEGLTQDYLEKYFDQKNSGFRPVKEIRDMIIFSKHDIIKDPPFSNLDLISCRNLLIYFNNDLQKAIINTFHYSLKLGGILFLGQSETVGNVNTMFSVLHNKDKIYKKTSEIAVAVPHSVHFLKRFDDNEVKTNKKKTMTVLLASKTV